MRIIAILFAVGAYLELYVALGERSPWGPLFVGLVLAFLSNVAARMEVTESAIASGSQHSAMRAIGPRIARLLSVLAPAASAA